MSASRSSLNFRRKQRDSDGAELGTADPRLSVGMKAWLITWEWMAQHAAVADRIAGILPPQWSPKAVARFAEVFYAMTNSTVAELMAYARRPSANPYRCKFEVINGVPHADLMRCGGHPWLSARRVSNLVVSEENGYESVSWTDPDTYKPDARGLPELARRGENDSHTRIVQGRLLTTLTWDWMAGEVKPEFRRPVVSRPLP